MALKLGGPAGVTAYARSLGDHVTRLDVAVLWPPRRPPIVVAVLSTRSAPAAAPDNGLVAAAARTILRGLGVPP
jgi:beta-lactamase class A